MQVACAVRTYSYQICHSPLSSASNVSQCTPMTYSGGAASELAGHGSLSARLRAAYRRLTSKLVLQKFKRLCFQKTTPSQETLTFVALPPYEDKEAEQIKQAKKYQAEQIAQSMHPLELPTEPKEQMLLAEELLQQTWSRLRELPDDETFYRDWVIDFESDRANKA